MIIDGSAFVHTIVCTHDSSHDCIPSPTGLAWHVNNETDVVLRVDDIYVDGQRWAMGLSSHHDS